jgi:hypothetical protein
MKRWKTSRLTGPNTLLRRKTERTVKRKLTTALAVAGRFCLLEGGLQC